MTHFQISRLRLRGKLQKFHFGIILNLKPYDNRTATVHPYISWFVLQANFVFPFWYKEDQVQLRNVAKAVGNVYDITAEGEMSVERWIQISCFLKDLQTKCTNRMFMVFTAWIGVTLLNRFVTSEHDQDYLLESMVNCLTCGSVLAVAVRDHKYSKLCRKMYSEYKHCLDEYFDLIGKSSIFLTDPFHQHTVSLLKAGVQHMDKVTLTKFLNLVWFALDGEPESDAVENMFRICTTTPQLDHFVDLTMRKKPTVDKSHLLSIFKILEFLLRYVIFVALGDP